MSRGFFVAFEGGEGTGKSTQIHAVRAAFEAQGRPVEVTFEPGGTPLGNKIRALLLEPQHGPVHPRCEALLFAAARAQHIEEKILPGLKAGKLMLCDRYWDASRAYQGVARELGISAIDRINNWATGGRVADRVYLFDIDPVEGLKRAKARNNAPSGPGDDRMEQESLDFHREIRSAYLHIAKQEPARYRVIDALRPVAEITAELLQDIAQCWANQTASPLRPHF